MRLTPTEASNPANLTRMTDLVLEWLWSQRVGRAPKWERRVCSFSKCANKSGCLYRETEAWTHYRDLPQRVGRSHYCTAPDREECEWKRAEWKPGGRQVFRAETLPEPTKFRRDRRTRAVTDEWARQLASALSSDSETIATFAAGYRWGEWEPYLAVARCHWPRLDRNAAIERGYEGLAAWVAAGAASTLGGRSD